jgi:hypothetical protein
VLILEVLDSVIVDLGIAAPINGKLKLPVPLLGFAKKEHPRATIVQGSAGIGVTLKNQRLSGNFPAAGIYTFTVEYFAPKTYKLIRVRYRYTVL